MTNIEYLSIRFENDIPKNLEGNVEDLHMMMMPTKGICEIFGGALIRPTYLPTNNGHDKKTVLSHTYAVRESTVETYIDLINGKIATRIISMPEHLLLNLVDCFRTIYQKDGEQTLLHGEPDDIDKWFK